MAKSKYESTYCLKRIVFNLKSIPIVLYRKQRMYNFIDLFVISLIYNTIVMNNNR